MKAQYRAHIDTSVSRKTLKIENLKKLSMFHVEQFFFETAFHVKQKRSKNPLNSGDFEVFYRVKNNF